MELYTHTIRREYRHGDADWEVRAHADDFPSGFELVGYGYYDPTNDESEEPAKEAARQALRDGLAWLGLDYELGFDDFEIRVSEEAE